MKTEQLSLVKMPPKDNTERNAKLRWENGFQRWSDEQAGGNDYYGKCAVSKNGREPDICANVDTEHCLYKEYAERLIESGYGDVSEYKAEIERLRQEVRDTDKMARNTIEQYRAENEELKNALKQSEDNYSRAFERLKAQGREIGKLKAGNKQAQIDVLNKVKDLMDKYYVFEGVCGYFIDDFKELIKEVQNAENKG